MVLIPAVHRAIPAVLSAALCAGAATTPARAHDGVHERVAALTVQIEGQSDSASLRLQRAELLRLHGQFTAALLDVRRAEELDPAAGIAHRLRADIALDRSCHTEALIHIDALLVARPNDARAWRMRAVALTGQGDLEPAAATWDIALSLLDPPEPDDYAARLAVVIDLGDFDRALAGLHEAEHRLGAVIALQLAAVEIDTRLGEFDRALARLDTLSAHSPRKERWHLRRGDLLATAGRTEQAAEAWRAALVAIAELQPRQRSTNAVASLSSEVQSRLAGLTTDPEVRHP